VRFLAALAIAAAILGAVGRAQRVLTQRVRFDVTRDAHDHHHEEPQAGETWHYRIELTPTFEAASDPFAIRTDAAEGVPRLLVRHAGQDLLRLARDWSRGQVVVVESVSLAGTSTQLFIQASPSGQEADKPCGVRVRVVRADGAICDDQTIWSEGGGALLAQTVDVSLEPVLERLDRGLGKGGA